MASDWLHSGSCENLASIEAVDRNLQSVAVGEIMQALPAS